MAIYGKETSYGSVTGSFDLLDVSATLAYEGRRRAFFEDEFIAALKLLHQGVRRGQLSRRYAGATGLQFMPTVALRLRADGDGDGHADIWRSEADAFSPRSPTIFAMPASEAKTSLGNAGGSRPTARHPGRDRSRRAVRRSTGVTAAG